MRESDVCVARFDSHTSRSRQQINSSSYKIWTLSGGGLLSRAGGRMVPLGGANGQHN